MAGGASTPLVTAIMADSHDHACPQRFAGDALRAPAATVEQREPASPRVSSLRAGWRWLLRLNARLEDSWIGDLIGAACLFAAGYLLIVFAWVLA